jgi:hypothetical protein
LDCFADFNGTYLNLTAARNDGDYGGGGFAYTEQDERTGTAKKVTAVVPWLYNATMPQCRAKRNYDIDKILFLCKM